VTAALAGGQTAGVAAWAETIHLGTHALVDQVKPEDPERAQRLHAVLEHAARLADEVIAAAGRKEIDLAAAAHRRLQSALALARLRLPPTITQAPPEAIREAKPAPTDSEKRP
jgi:tRNA A37 N6-isopentenylltransferase MiaA